jgi:hypothetical protein
MGPYFKIFHSIYELNPQNFKKYLIKNSKYRLFLSFFPPRVLFEPIKLKNCPINYHFMYFTDI